MKNVVVLAWRNIALSGVLRRWCSRPSISGNSRSLAEAKISFAAGSQRGNKDQRRPLTSVEARAEGAKTADGDKAAEDERSELAERYPSEIQRDGIRRSDDFRV